MAIITEKPNFKKNTLLYGGSFDPIHLGHVSILNSCLEQLEEIRQVVLLPCAQSPGKSRALASDADRLRWLELAFPDEVLVWTEEILRGGESYMIETLKVAASLGARSESLFLLVGSDSYNSLDHWKHSDQLRDYTRIVVADRPGAEVILAHPGDIQIDVDPRSTSSTEIRESLASGDIPERELPQVVADDIRTLILNSTNPYVK